jgi:deoxyribodipyrimidine photolyase-related protein
MSPGTTLRLILGDQLNPRHTWFEQQRDDVLYVLMEMRQETDYVLHHAQKIIAIFAAMRDLARQLRAAGHGVHYLTIDDPDNRQALPDNLDALLVRFNVRALEYQAPDEWRLDAQLADYGRRRSIPCRMVGSEHFYTRRDEAARLFSGRKQWVREHFYRHMRVQHRVLIHGASQPIGGQWNFDHYNRKPWPGATVRTRRLPGVSRPFSALVDDRLRRRQHLRRGQRGTTGLAAQSRRSLAATRCLHREGAAALRRLSGRDEPSRLANVSLALVICTQHQDARPARGRCQGRCRLARGMRIPGNSRGLHPADYRLARVHSRLLLGAHAGVCRAERLDHTRALPGWFWTGQTRMRCLAHAIGQCLEQAYAHHIQRLMVIGNLRCWPDWTPLRYIAGISASMSTLSNGSNSPTPSA